MDATPPIFLTADWRMLVMLNYAVEPAVLQPFVPRGTELDTWRGTHYVSMVGFLFLNTRLRGLAIPFHRNFEEVNLRFYVRQRGPEGWRRGVVFIKELVPRRAIALVARWLYNENYQALPMRHRFQEEMPFTNERYRSWLLRRWLAVEYGWRWRGQWHTLRARPLVGAVREPPLQPGSEAEFITEHYWGYARQRDGGTVAYRVEHPPWRVWPAADAELQVDAAALYGPQWAEVLGGRPLSAFVAEGSAVTVYRGMRDEG